MTMVHLENNSKTPVLGVRHLQCLLLFWGVTFAYAMRVNLSLAIVAMTDSKSSNPNFTEYTWSEKTRSIVLSSFFWGYITTQVPGGYLARKFGGKYSILISICCSSTLAILTPLAARIGDWPLVCALRVVQGMTQGVLFPTTHTILAKWAPPTERAVLGTYIYSGSQFGTVSMLFASGFIAASPLGWPSIFYISGGLGVLWSFAWYIWGASSPKDYKNITLAEKEFIESSLATGNEKEPAKKLSLKTPWLKFLTSPAFLALTITQCAFTYCFWIILTQIPSYMKNVMGFDIKSNASLTALPYLVMFMLSFVFTGLGAYTEKRKWLNLTQSRKTFNTIATWVPAVALASLGFVDANHAKLAVVLLVIAVGFSAAIAVGLQVNHIDLSPNFAGIILGTSNVIANIMSIMAPLTVGFIVTEEKNVLQWHIVFLIAASFCFIGNLMFIIFGTAKVQPWNEPVSATKQELEPFKDEAKNYKEDF